MLINRIQQFPLNFRLLTIPYTPINSRFLREFNLLWASNSRKLSFLFPSFHGIADLKQQQLKTLSHETMMTSFHHYIFFVLKITWIWSGINWHCTTHCGCYFHIALSVSNHLYKIILPDNNFKISFQWRSSKLIVLHYEWYGWSKLPGFMDTIIQDINVSKIPQCC